MKNSEFKALVEDIENLYIKLDENDSRLRILRNNIRKSLNTLKQFARVPDSEPNYRNDECEFYFDEMIVVDKSSARAWDMVPYNGKIYIDDCNNGHLTPPERFFDLRTDSIRSLHNKLDEYNATKALEGEIFE